MRTRLAIRVQLLAQPSVLAKWDRLRRSGFREVQPAVRAIHVAAADHHRAFRESGEGRDQLSGVVLGHRAHVDDDLRIKGAERGLKGCQLAAIAVKMEDRGRKRSLANSTMKNRHVAASLDQLLHYLGTEEAGASDD